LQTLRERITFLLVMVAGGLALASCAGKPSESGKAPEPAQAAELPSATPAAAPQSPEAPAASPEAGSQGPGLQPQLATGAVQGVPAPTNTAPIIAVANYFTELPGFDLAGLAPRQRERFLQRVNSEMCTCGCRNDTLAHCYVNDQRCPVVKGMVQKAFEEAKAGK
jgi:hypothetical protein